MEIVRGTITDISQDGTLTIKAACDLHKYIKKQYDEVRIALDDGRSASNLQKSKAHALINEIAAYTGDLPANIKRLTKLDFVAKWQDDTFKQMFSLANCSMDNAREYISYLIEFILEWDIPTKVPLITLCDDTERYMYYCAIHKKCCITGKKAEFHHIDAVGMGRDRDEICHIGMRGYTLCREKHDEAHTKGDEYMQSQYHILPLVVDEKIQKVYKLGKVQKA